MKKYLKILLAISVLFSLCSCSLVSNFFQKYNYNFSDNNLNSQKVNDYRIEYKKSKNFIIYTDENKTGFVYIIIDNYGREIDSGFHNYRGNFDIYEKSGLLVLEYGFGGNSWQEKFYDVELGRASQYFQNPLDVYNEVVAYFEIDSTDTEIYLVIQNIFEPSIYYEKILWEYSSSVFRHQPEATFIDNGTKLKISYYDEMSNKIITRLIQIVDQGIQEDGSKPLKK